MIDQAVTPRTFRRLSRDELETFDRDGYLLIPHAVEAGVVSSVLAATEALAAKHGRERLESGSAYERVNVIEDDPSLLDLMEHPAVLGTATSLLGGALQLLISTLTYRPTSSAPGIRWHTDDPSPYFFPRIQGTCPIWQLKICVYLSDVVDGQMGNFVASPGSHKTGLPQPAPEHRHVLDKARYLETPDVVTAIDGAREITAKAGDVLLFHPGLWHSVSPNQSGITRKNVWYVFGPLWMRLGDRDRSSERLIESSDPVRRQLLGSTTVPQRSALAPTDEGAPLIQMWEGMPYEDVYRRERDSLLHSWWSAQEQQL